MGKVIEKHIGERELRKIIIPEKLSNTDVITQEAPDLYQH